ncbi:MAG: YcgN family cysteine cluster protein [Gammaproteobacteria bacterium]|nr:YcgN family cysteine cluster protein [Gammaproteobacteria bacterium]
MTDKKPFWERKKLAEMTLKEWESLCDGCGKCCLHKLEHEESREVFYTRVVCQYLDQDQCRCMVYGKRKKTVPDCVVLTPKNLEDLSWMPGTCAYRLLHENKPLPIWHPLITGNRNAIIASDNTVTGKVISEEFVHEDGFEEHLVDWAD